MGNVHLKNLKLLVDGFYELSKKKQAEARKQIKAELIPAMHQVEINPVLPSGRHLFDLSEQEMAEVQWLVDGGLNHFIARIYNRFDPNPELADANYSAWQMEKLVHQIQVIPVEIIQGFNCLHHWQDKTEVSRILDEKIEAYVSQIPEVQKCMAELAEEERLEQLEEERLKTQNNRDNLIQLFPNIAKTDSALA